MNREAATMIVKAFEKAKHNTNAPALCMYGYIGRDNEPSQDKRIAMQWACDQIMETAKLFNTRTSLHVFRAENFLRSTREDYLDDHELHKLWVVFWKGAVTYLKHRFEI